MTRRRARIAALERVRRTRSVILGYHGIADRVRRDDMFFLQVPPRRFADQIDDLQEAGFRFTTVSEFLREMQDGVAPAGVAVITFDDGFRNNLTTALPIVRERGVRATVYVVSGWLGARNPWIGANGDGELVTGDEVRTLFDAGWEIGAHTVTHADLSVLDYDDCRREIAGCCDALEKITGTRVETLAYPFGRYGSAAVDAARNLGLLGAVTVGSGIWDPFELTRAMIGPVDPFPLVWLKLTDRYEPMLRSRPMRFVRGASRSVRGSLGA